ncbi:MAG: TlpA family protein disulfide reductase [Carboxylicivirga sp.]|jgi:thiol-disulfide isomerase/thioredoxin|nr:TlpA family protein disulfide reductase [Carboxylicivirga sp.]
MKKLFLLSLCLIGLLSSNAQKVVHNPKVGGSTTTNIQIEKITLADSATVFDCKINYRPGYWVSIPSKTCLKVDNKDESFFVKHVTGHKLDDKIFMPESGKMDVQIVFPPIDKNAAIVDYLETNGGGWNIYDIQLVPQKYTGAIPEALSGDWFLNDGSQSWIAGLYEDCIIYDNAIWNYSIASQKAKQLTFQLKNETGEKVLILKKKDDNTLLIGSDKKNLVYCSKKPVSNPEYHLADNTGLTQPDFKTVMTQYSGYLKGFSPKMKQRTGMLYINNIFTGEQVSHLVKINDDGSFSTQVPLSHTQIIYIRLPLYNGMIYLEPGKSLVHCIDKDRKTAGESELVMGESAQLNRDMAKYHNIRNFKHNEVMKMIGGITPQEYVEYCNKSSIMDQKEWKQLQDSVMISKKALELAEMDFKYNKAVTILSYSLNLRSQMRKDPSIKPQQLKKEHLSFLGELPLNDARSVYCSSYKIFINYSMFNNLLTNRDLYKPDFVALANLLKKKDAVLSEDEQMTLDATIQNQQADYNLKLKELDAKYQSIKDAMFTKNMKTVRSFMQKSGRSGWSMKELADEIIASGGSINDEEQSMVDAYSDVLSPENLAKEREYQSQYADKLNQIQKKFEKEINQIRNTNIRNYRTNQLKNNWGIEHNFTIDVMNAQSVCPSDQKYNTLSESELAAIPEFIKTPEILEFITSQNQKVLAQIEINKKNSKAVVNKVPETEGEKLFDEIIKKYRGNVVYVDFWATWCGPCRNAITTIKPLKEELKDEKVVFLYITNPSSPKATWENMIADIKGEHYRVSQDEWNILSSQFKISGIPHITLVGKEGHVINPHLSHGMSNEAVKSLLLKHVNEN